MKFIIAKTIEELTEAVNSPERNVEVCFLNKQITHFKPIPVEEHNGVVVLRLYTPKLKSIKNAPCVATQMNWLIVEEANLTKIETADEANLSGMTVCSLPCLEDREYEITEDLMLNNGFVRLSLAWQQFTHQTLRTMMESKDYHLKSKLFGCFHEMSSGMNMNNFPAHCPEAIKSIMRENNMLSCAEHKIAEKIASMDVGELALENI